MADLTKTILYWIIATICILSVAAIITGIMASIPW